MKSKFQKQPWEKSYVDVFKRYKAFECSRAAKKGQVSAIQDNNIGRKVFKLQGSVSASNYVNIPDPDTGIKSLGLHGNYIYLEFLPMAKRIFNFHLDFTISDFDPTIRFTISNMFDQYKKTSGNVLQIPFPKSAPEKWTIMVIDVPYHLENFGLFDATGFTNFDGIHIFKSAQICSATLFRNIYTSESVYKASTLPKEMNFKLPPKNQTWSDIYQFIYYPEVIDPDFMKDMEKLGPPPIEEIKQDAKDHQDPVLLSSIAEMKKIIQKPDGEQQYPEFQHQQQFDENLQQLQQDTQNLRQQSEVQQDDFIKRSFYNSNKFQQSQQQQQQTAIEGLQPFPIAELRHTVGFSGKYCPDIKWSRTQDSPNELVYAAGSVIVSNEIGTQNQRFFTGHSAPISCIDLSRDGKLIATAQEGNKSLVKIWDFCEGQNICTFQAPYEYVKFLSFSYNNKLLCTVGNDRLNRQQIIIWDISEIENKVKPEILAKQISDFNILQIKFSPIELDKLVSCGRENIRFWRIKNGHLPAQTLELNHHARNNVFTALDYEFSYQEPCAARQSGQIKRVFVGSASGMLYQIDYNSRQLEGVYKCHEGAICSLSLSAGFCVTGSDDMFLKVWPLDFSEYLIVAKHEGIIHSLDVSQDALMVACGTSTGGLGVLDLSNHNYKTILRSHTDEITDMVYHEYSGFLITLSNDLSIRVWDLEKYEQVYEFSYPPEDYCTCIAANPKSMTFSAGFASGTFRVFDIEKTCIIEEGRYHNSSITSIIYSQDGNQLYLSDQDSSYSIYDADRNYQPVKNFEMEMPSEHQSVAVTSNGAYIATIGDSGTHINIYDGKSFNPLIKLFCPNATIYKLIFSQNNQELFVITAESKIKIFAIESTPDGGAEAFFLREVACTHKDNCTDLCYTDNLKYMVTVGADSFLKVWDYDLALSGPGSNQVFMAHIGKINKCLFIPESNRLFTAGGFEGIYEWEFFGDLTPQEREIDLRGLQPQGKIEQKKKSRQQQNISFTQSKVSQELRIDFSDQDDQEVEQQLGIQQQEQYNLTEQQMMSHKFNRPELLQEQFASFQKQHTHQQQQSLLPKNLQQQNEEEEFQVTDSENNDQQELQDKYDGYDGEQHSFRKAQDILSNMSAQISKQQQKSKFVPQPIGQDFDPMVIDFKKQSRKKDRHRKHHAYTPNQVRKENNLPFRQYYNPGTSEQLKDKINRLRDNPENFNLDYVIGYNNDAHQNVVWNYMKGWYAYSLENIVVIEDLQKERQQKVVQLPDYISCMILSKDFKYLVVGSSTRNEKEIATIYVIETSKLQIVNKLNFHTRGVQSLEFNENGKYLVSIGNFRECTVCVWDWPSGKLVTSSYTMDKINDMKIATKCFSYDRIFEFVTVGRDQILFWALNKEKKLEYYDVFIPKEEDSEVYPEATSVDYILKGDKLFTLVGLQSGELLVYEYGSFKQIHKSQVASAEIVNIYGNSLINRVVLSSMDGYLYYWDTDKFSQEFYPSFVKLSFPSCPIGLSLEPTFNEGIAGCIEGGLFYFNIGNQYQSMLTSTINSNVKYQLQVLDAELVYTAHEDGKLRIWNIKSGEEIMGYNFKSQVTASYYNTSSQKLTCFFRNNNEVKILNLQNFSSSETYIENQYSDSDRLAHVYPVKAFEAILGGKQNRFVLLNDGSFFTIDQVIVQKKTIQRMQKILELKDVQDLQYLSEKSIIIVSDKSGKISTYLVDYDSERQIPYRFTSIDEYDVYENPHGNAIDSNKDDQTITAQLYKDTEAETKLVISRINQGCYYTTNTNLQYLFVRNYLKRQVVYRMALHDFPICPSLYESKESHYVHVALQNGAIEQVNIDDKDDREIMQGMLDSPITDLVSRKSKNYILVTTQNGISIYKC